MPTIKTPLEAALYTALKRITLYDSPERLRRASEKNWGVPFEEAIEMAYDLTAAAVCIGNAIAALKSPAAPSHAPPEGPRDAAPAQATCATCRFWRGNVANPTGGYCDMHVSPPPRSLVAYPREANFGCTLHQPRPVSADGAPGGEP